MPTSIRVLAMNSGWPTVDERDRRVLAAAAGAMGAEVAELDAEKIRFDTMHAHESVSALGPEMEAGARLYARLTGRQFAGVLAVSDLVARSGGGAPAVLVISREELSAELFRALCERNDAAQIPGLLVGDPGADLRGQILARAAAAVLGVRIPRRLEFLPQAIVASVGGEERLMVGRHAPATQVQDLVARGAGLMVVDAHSDGLDAFFAGGLTVCPMVDRPRRFDLERSPVCHASGHCSRTGLGVEHAQATGRLLSPASFCAGILVWNCGFAVVNEGSPLDPRWSLLWQLANNPRIGAIVCAWSKSPVHAPVYAPLLAELEAGRPIGEAVQQHNRRRAVCERQQWLTLFGDPALRAMTRASLDCPRAVPEATAPAKDPVRPRPPRPVGEAKPTGDELQRGFHLWRAMLEWEIVHGDPSRHEMAFAMLKVLARGEIMAYGQDAEAWSRGEHGVGFRAQAVNYLIRRARVFGDWIAFSDQQTVDSRTETCTHCGAPACVTEIEIAFLRTRRAIVTCPRCHVTADRPADLDLGLALHGRGQLLVKAPLPSGRWDAAVMVWSMVPSDGKVSRVPIGADGGPSHLIELGDEWPPHVFHASMFLVWDAEFAVLSRRASRPRIAS